MSMFRGRDNDERARYHQPLMAWTLVSFPLTTASARICQPVLKPLVLCGYSFGSILPSNPLPCRAESLLLVDGAASPCPVVNVAQIRKILSRSASLDRSPQYLFGFRESSLHQGLTGSPPFYAKGPNPRAVFNGKVGRTSCLRKSHAIIHACAGLLFSYSSRVDPGTYQIMESR